MRLFSRRQSEPNPADFEMIREVQNRVREMRQRMGRRCVELPDLFALLREDERTIMQVVESKRPAAERVWPDQIPSKPGRGEDRTPKGGISDRT
jgi:hypothetical protein